MPDASQAFRRSSRAAGPRRRRSGEPLPGCDGFAFDRFWGEPPGFVILRRDKLHFMLKQATGHSKIVPDWTVSLGLWDMYFYVDASIAVFTARGARIGYVLCDQPYACWEFGTQDVDGRDVGFGQDIVKP